MSFGEGDILFMGKNRDVFPFRVHCEEALLVPASSSNPSTTGCRKAAPRVFATNGKK
jgi:hypothetical protein